MSDMIRSSKVLRSAKGQACTARFPRICNNDPATTVWAHLNGHAFGKGAAVKAHDVIGFHACYACHTYYDTGHGTRPILTEAELLRYVLEAVTATYVRLIRMGIVVVPIDVETPHHDKPVKPRKPRSARKAVGPSGPIQSRGFSEQHRKLVSRNDLKRQTK